jgi:geranylgeranyl diphosphate synthase, type II
MDPALEAADASAANAHLARALEAGDAGSRLWAALRSTVDGGRRIRPRVLLSAYDDLAGSSAREPRDVAERIAGAMEVLHIAFLAHDDVIDDDHTRHGRRNVAGTYAAQALHAGASHAEAHAYGAAAGILAGDLALATAFRQIAQSGALPDTTTDLLDLFHATLHITADGELSDVWLGLDHQAAHDADLAEVLATAERKTAVYTFELPLRAAALLAGRQGLEGPLSRLGRLLGVAFQLRDDLDGTFGDPATTGKSAESDLRDGKHTALVALARATPAWEQIAAVLGRRNASPEELAVVRDLLESCGARAGVERMVCDLEQSAARLATELGLERVLALVTSSALARGCADHTRAA